VVNFLGCAAAPASVSSFLVVRLPLLVEGLAIVTWEVVPLLGVPNCRTVEVPVAIAGVNGEDKIPSVKCATHERMIQA